MGENRSTLTYFASASAMILVCGMALFWGPQSLAHADRTVKSSRDLDAATRAGLGATYAQLPLRFELNQGQTDANVRFLSRGSGYTLFLTSSKAILALRQSGDRAGKAEAGPQPRTADARRGAVLSMELAGADPAPRIAGIEELPGRSHYFIGKDPEKWRTDVPAYARVHYRNVYPGVDLIYYGNRGQLEFDFVIAPASDPEAIELSFDGARRLEKDDRGDLLIHLDHHTIRLLKPAVYQEAGGVRREVSGGYVLNGKDRVGFQVAAYDAGRPLVIDPVLSYSTYLGGSNEDWGSRIAVDSEGNVYVAGITRSLDFPTSNPVQQTNRGREDAFVAKLNATGSELVYSAYLGGSLIEYPTFLPWPGDDQGFGIAVDGDGNAYVTGTTASPDFPTVNAVQPAIAGLWTGFGSADAFVAKLNATGDALLYSTYLGGSGIDVAHGIALDGGGNAYVAGETTSADYPTVDPWQPAYRSNYCHTGYGLRFGFPCSDGFVSKVNPSDSALVYSTYLGGRDIDKALSIAVDPAGNAYVTGSTRSPDFPTVEPVQPVFGGSTYTATAGDAFVTKLSASGSMPLYSTYLGGGSDESGLGIGVDSAGNAYVTGFVKSSNFPTANPLQPIYGGGFSDAFVAKIADPAPCIPALGDLDPPGLADPICDVVPVVDPGSRGSRPRWPR